MKTTLQPGDDVIAMGATIVMRTFVKELAGRKIPECRTERAIEIMRECLKEKIIDAIADTKSALDCHMDKIAEATFAASMVLIGTEAFKRFAAEGHLE